MGERVGERAGGRADGRAERSDGDHTRSSVPSIARAMDESGSADLIVSVRAAELRDSAAFVLQVQAGPTLSEDESQHGQAVVGASAISERQTAEADWEARAFTPPWAASCQASPIGSDVCGTQRALQAHT